MIFYPGDKIWVKRALTKAGDHVLSGLIAPVRLAKVVNIHDDYLIIKFLNKPYLSIIGRSKVIEKL